MKKLSLIIFLMVSLQASAQGFQAFVNSLFATPATQRQARVDSFMSANNQFPLIEDDSVANFILTGSHNLVQVAGDMNGWDPTSAGFTMLKVPSTNFFFLTRYFETNARLDYKFVTNGSTWILDPNNPNQVSGGFGPNSELKMPFYVDPWEIESYPQVAKGGISTHNFNSTYLNGNYEVKVYVPAGYDSTRSYPTAYFHDGTEYISLANAVNVLDNLIDSGLVEPLIGVFVKPNDRNEEYAFSKKDAYTDFFIQELVPWVDANWSTQQDSSRRATIGASFGGNISMYICLKHPEVFYKTGQHSGAWWPEQFKVLNMYATTSFTDLPMAGVWGSYEGGLHDMWEIVRDSSNFYGYTNKYFNHYPEGHSWGLWRATTDELLMQLFPGTTVVSIPERDLSPSWTVYPNPADDLLQLDGENLRGKLAQIFNLSGEPVLEMKIPDDLRIDLTTLDSGLYLLNIDGKTLRLKILR